MKRNLWFLPACQSLYLTEHGPAVTIGTPVVNGTVDVPTLDREALIAAFERWLRQQPHLMNALHELRGCNLVCWCAPLPCHGDVLLRMANAP